ncbi:MAG: cytochrome c-type biogenesis protein CcmH [Gammaproteobacteria bacterium]|nr:cytochrome c-type biogenesis protein CcmH [Gammaproteobacteria bacterium]MBP6052179.1 cytochrome c-type biogenesis protein CcmH [Pseudomonadales bacterium]MBK6582241.1 cytochrome c-type biogenesis protein CcmH [Gammaproteobacteria bacterium]MBK7171346.1 cytochrome c-type biogenesis protein CcmH [Gammaproteobacteria bacterium]MBK7521486.1 cytochrome c-type biogenesis protein CcmH [Gammaproteobacteria bacterium]
MRRAMPVLLLVIAGFVHAAIDAYDFDSEEQRQRYLEFTRELRCPKCQNQNLADSNAPIAADLRRELHRLLVEGRTDPEIVDFMVSRYGDYVLYNPPVERRTWLLWLAPLAMLGGGLMVLAGMLRRARANRLDASRQATGPAALSEQERRRLDELLKDEATRR